LDHCHETRGTLSINRIESGSVRDSGDKGSSPGHGRSAARCQHCSYGDILYQSGVDSGRFNDALAVRTYGRELQAPVEYRRAYLQGKSP
jgi:hypothetical protein